MGSLLGGVTADSLGRKRALQLNSIPLLIGSVISAIAQNIWILVFGRFVIGVGVGLSSALVPLYIGEMSAIHVRGMMGTFNQLGICVGLLAAFFINAVVPGSQWRQLFWVGVVMALCMGIGMGIICPESPRWLLQFDREKAVNLAKKLWGPNGGTELESPEDPEQNPQHQQKQLPQNVLQNLDKHTIKMLWIGCIIFTIQQLSGINAIFYYSSSVFHKVGIKSEAYASVSVGLVNIFGTILATILIDQSGRKKLLLFSLIVQGAAMSIMAITLKMQFFQQFSGMIALSGTLIYVLAFAIGMGPVPALLLPEILPDKIRGMGMSLALGTHWIFNFLIGQIFLEAISMFGVSTVYLCFALVCFCGTFFVQRNLIETAGKSIEEIEVLMKENSQR
eukprot:TRINITY_DN8676_c0_g2_i3.p1 TRINITY_DN8676_c0_g2~~TRINITY_DN8676_c0_g2_i3.p1  ORF type:complete len:392 (+),score=39.70 TRINITY_DN8676_c0_g2_i3:565-1740(+)